MRIISKYWNWNKAILIWGGLLISATAFGQSRFTPSGMRVGLDGIAIGRSFFDPSLNYFEINSDMTFDKYILAFDYGVMSYNRGFNSETNRGDYSNQGHYIRVGVDLNLIPKDLDNNVIFLGLRYARSFFNEKLGAFINDPIYGEIDQELQNVGMSAGWLEFVGGMKVKVTKNVFLGYTFRYKFLRRRSALQDFVPHDIPGFGRESSSNGVGFNYHIFYQIPFKNKTSKIVTLP